MCGVYSHIYRGLLVREAAENDIFYVHFCFGLPRFFVPHRRCLRIIFLPVFSRSLAVFVRAQRHPVGFWQNQPKLEVPHSEIRGRLQGMDADWGSSPEVGRLIGQGMQRF